MHEYENICTQFVINGFRPQLTGLRPNKIMYICLMFKTENWWHYDAHSGVPHALHSFYIVL